MIKELDKNDFREINQKIEKIIKRLEFTPTGDIKVVDIFTQRMTLTISDESFNKSRIDVGDIIKVVW